MRVSPDLPSKIVPPKPTVDYRDGAIRFAPKPPKPTPPKKPPTPPKPPTPAKKVTPPPAPAPTPEVPVSKPPETRPTPPKVPKLVASATKMVKPATPDIIMSEDIMSGEVISGLFFETIGSQEILDVARRDLIDGLNVSYSPIKNLSALYAEYNPNNILGSQPALFQNYPIALDPHIVPDGEGTGPNGESIYFDTSTNSLIINVKNISAGESVEVAFLNAVELINATIE